MRTIRTIAALFVTIAILGVAAPAEAWFFKKIVRTVSSAGGAVARTAARAAEEAARAAARAAEEAARAAARAAEEAARAAARAAEEAARAAESGAKFAVGVGDAAAKIAGGDVVGGTEALIDATKAGVGAVPGMAGGAIEAGAGVVGAAVGGTKELADPTIAVGKLTIDTTKATAKFFVKGVVDVGEGAAGVAGKILEESWEILTRCYADAEKETDPEERQEEIKKCDEKQTGNILGTVGMAIGAPFGPGGMALGAAGGSLAGSAIDGSPNIFIKTVLPISPPAPESESEPAPEDSPTPESEPAPEVSPTPESEPAPEDSPTPESEPAPEDSPTPESEPAPEMSPAPGSEPAPEVSPAPGSEPAPEVSPAPGAGFFSGVGGGRASVSDRTLAGDLGMDPWSDHDPDADGVEVFFMELEQQLERKLQPIFEAVGTTIESTGTTIKDAVIAYGEAKDTEVVGPLLNIVEDMVKTMKWLGPGRVLSHLLKPTPLNVGEEDFLRDHGKRRGSEFFEDVDTTPLPSATEESPSSEPAPEDSPAPEPRT